MIDGDTQGTIVQGIHGTESPTDTLTTIFARDGDCGHTKATVSVTFPPGCQTISTRRWANMGSPLVTVDMRRMKVGWLLIASAFGKPASSVSDLPRILAFDRLFGRG